MRSRLCEAYGSEVDGEKRRHLEGTVSRTPFDLQNHGLPAPDSNFCGFKFHENRIPMVCKPVGLYQNMEVNFLLLLLGFLLLLLAVDFSYGVDSVVRSKGLRFMHVYFFPSVWLPRKWKIRNQHF